MVVVGSEQLAHLGIALHVCHRHHVGRIHCLGKAYCQVTAILMAKFIDICKQLQALHKRWILSHFGSRSTIFTYHLPLTVFLEAPELLGKIPSQEIRVFLKVLFVDREIIIRESTAGTAGTLNHSPNPVAGTNLHPGITHFLTIRTGGLRS